MSRQANTKSSEQIRDIPEEGLGYIREAVSAAEPSDSPPAWQAEQEDLIEAAAQAFLGMELRLAELRTYLRALGLKPKGRTRVSLATQLAEAYLDREHLADAVNSLTDRERQYAAKLLLYFNLQAFQVHADPAYWRDDAGDWVELVKPLVKAGLFLQEQDDPSLIWMSRFRERLPPLHMMFPPAQIPRTSVGVADPQALLGQLQQMMGLIQSEKFALRPRLMWQAPEYPYAKQITCWPPTPDDVRAIIRQIDRERVIELLPPEPALDQASLDQLTRALGVSEHWVEFLYHMLVAIGVVRSGEILTIDTDQTQAWMTLPPSRQLGVIYSLYCDLQAWAAWWPRWQDKDLHLRLTYHGYWALMSLAHSVQTSTRNLRRIMLAILSHLPDNVWLSVDQLSRWLGQIFPTSDSHRYMLKLEPTCEPGGWQGFLRAVLVDMLTGPLYALGLVEIGPSLDEVAVVRLKDLQSVHWGRTRDLDLMANVELSSDALRFVAEDEMLEITAPVPPDFTTMLLRWANPTGFSHTLVCYRLDAQKLHQAFQQGYGPESLSAAWRSCVNFDPLPEVAAWWNTWYERYARVRLYPPQALLQTRDAMTMQELQVALPTLHRSIMSAFPPAAALLKPEDVDALLDDLKRLGYMPKESS